MGDLSPNFSRHEFSCSAKRCDKCLSPAMDARLIDLLEQFRAATGGKPIRPGSGYRCPWFNGRAGGSFLSQHQYSKAVDFAYPDGLSPRDCLEIAKEVGFTGIGLYSTYMHVDVRDGEVVIWDER